MPKRRWLALSAGLGLIAGCSSHPTAPTSHLAATASPTTPAPLTRLGSAELDLTDARRIGVPRTGGWDAEPVLKMPAEADPSVTGLRVPATRGALALTPEGTVIYAAAAAPAVGKGEVVLGAMALGTYSTSGDRAVPALKAPAAQQSAGAAASDQAVAWFETSSTQAGAYPWRLLVHRFGSSTRLVAQSTEGATEADGAAEASDTASEVGQASEAGQVFVDGHRIYWSTGGSVYSRDLWLEKPTRLEESGVRSICVSQGYLYFEKDHEHDPQTPRGQIRLTQRQLATGTDRLARTYRPVLGPATLGLAACHGASFAWRDREFAPGASRPLPRGEMLYLYHRNQLLTLSSPGMSFGQTSLTGDYLSFGLTGQQGAPSDGERWLYRLNDGQFSLLPEKPTTFLGNEEYVGWDSAAGFTVARVPS